MDGSPKFRSSELIRAYMHKRNLDRVGLAAKLNRHPETVRRLEEGLSFPPSEVEDKLIAMLEMTPEEAKEFRHAVKCDRWVKDFGPPPESAPATPIDAYWRDLTTEQRETLICIAECFTRPKANK